MILEMDYSEFINITITQKNLRHQYKLKEQGTDKYYYLFAYDDGIEYMCKINNIDDVDNVSDYETNHIANANKRIVDEEKIIALRRELTPDSVGSNYQFHSIHIDIAASIGWHETTFSFPVDIALFGGSCLVNGEHTNDQIQILILDHVIVGVLTQNVDSSKNEIHVSDSVIQNVLNGFDITLFDGTNTNDLNRITAIDYETNKLTLETNTSDAFLASTPTYAKLSVYLTRYCHFKSSGAIRLGGKAGSSLIKANTQMKLRYYNNEALAKKFSFILEYFY